MIYTYSTQKKELFPIHFRVSIFKSPYGGFFVAYNLSKHSQASQAQRW